MGNKSDYRYGGGGLRGEMLQGVKAIAASRGMSVRFAGRKNGEATYTTRNRKTGKVSKRATTTQLMKRWTRVRKSAK